MPGYEIGIDPPDITLNTYSGAGVNDGTEVHLQAYFGGVLLLSFVNAASDYGWLAQMRQIKDDPGIPGGAALKVVGVLFNHNGSDFTFCTSGNVQQAVQDAGLGAGDMDDIPLLVDSTGSWSGQYLGGILTDPCGCFKPSVSEHRMWSYLISRTVYDAQTRDWITDKWHTGCTANPPDPISFRHLDIGGVNPFDSAIFTNTRAYVVQRIVNLSQAPVILKADPVEHSVLTAMVPVTVVFSRPMESGPAATPGNYVLGGGAVTAGAGPAAGADYPYELRIENKVGLSFGAVTLDDGGPDDTLTVAVDGAQVTDTGKTALSGDNVIDYIVDLTAPRPVISPVGFTGPTNQDPFQVRVDFGEVVADFPVSLVDIPSGNAAVTAKTPNSAAAVYTLTVDPAGTAGTVVIRIPAGITTDQAGRDNLASDPFSVVFDKDPPQPVITSTEVTDGGSTDLVSFGVKVDFGEPMSGNLLAGYFALTNCALGAISADAANQVFSVAVQAGGPGAVSLQFKASQLSDEAGNQNLASNTFTVTVTTAERLKEIVLLMDFSNSMNWEVTLDGVPQPKIELMKPEITKFIDKLFLACSAGMAQSGDSLTLVSYKSTAQSVPVNGATWVTLNTPGDSAQNTVTNLAAGGATAMGAGLAIALNLLNYTESNADHDKDRAIVMFADGQDNVSPHVETGAACYAIHDPGTGSTSGFPPGMGDINVCAGDADRIPIHTIGIHTEGHGDTSPWLQKLAHLSASVTGGIDHATPANQIWPLVEYDFDDIWEQIYPNSSPQVVFRRQGRLEADESAKTEAFFLNGRVRSLIVCLSWPGAVPLKLSLYRNGRRVDGAVGAVRRDRYVLVTLAFPGYEPLPGLLPVDKTLTAYWRRLWKGEKIAAAGPPAGLTGKALPREGLKAALGEYIQSLGSWQVRVERCDGLPPAQAPYSLSVIADEKSLRYHVYTPSYPLFTGLPLKLAVRVEEMGIPLEHLYQAEVTVTRPRYALADVLARYAPQLPPFMPPAAPLEVRSVKASKAGADTTLHEKSGDLSNLARAFEALKKIPQAAAEMSRTEVHRVNLEPVYRRQKGKRIWERGFFSGIYPQADVPGFYRLEVVLRGVGRRTGVFERTTSRALLVLPRLDAHASQGEAVYDAQSGALKISLLPRDRFGNRLGPGYAGAVAANFDHKLAVVEQLDGRYVVEAVIPEKELRKLKLVRISMLGLTVFKAAAESLIAG